MFPRVEVRHLRAVDMLAEELNFTRAADRLHITQSGFSKQINEVETQNGFNLFIRKNKRNVELTEVGRIFIEEARLAILHLERAVRAAREHAPDDQRGAANGVTLLGQFLGPTAGTLAGGLILARFGWPWVFFALGGLSLLWLIPWLTMRLGLPPSRDRPAPAGDNVVAAGSAEASGDGTADAAEAANSDGQAL